MSNTQRAKRDGTGPHKDSWMYRHGQRMQEVYAALLRYAERIKAAMAMLVMLLISTSVLAGDPAPKLDAKVVKAATEQKAKAKIVQPKSIIIWQSINGTSIPDYAKPALKIERNTSGDLTAWQTIEGTTIKDFTRPVFKAEKDSLGNMIVYSTIPGTTIKDFNKPSYIIKGK